MSMRYLLFLGVFISSCRPSNNGPYVKDLRDMLADTAKAYYYWNDLIPASFSPHAYSLTDTFTQEINAIKSFSPINAGLSPDRSGGTVHEDQDGFSRVQTESDYQAEQNGTSLSYGMFYEFAADSGLYVSQVDHASPAYQNGVRRGWKLTVINNLPVSYDQHFVDAFNSALNNASNNFYFIDANGNSVTLKLSQSGFGADEVNFAKVVTVPGKTIGYISYNSFYTPLRSDGGGGSHPGMDTAFADFKNQNVTDLIIDLRNNGGGYVNVATEMCNALIPSNFDGQLMFTENYNAGLTKAFSTQFPAKQLISKSYQYNPSLLTVNNVVFIVNNNTASASELVINNLLPYMPNIKIIGSWGNDNAYYQHTRGKPFGGTYFEFPSSNPQYAVYLLLDESKNAQANDAYVSGFKADLATSNGVQYDWGNPSDPAYAAAINYISTGVLSQTATNTLHLSSTRARNTSSPMTNLSLNRAINNHLKTRARMIVASGRNSDLRKILNSAHAKMQLKLNKGN